MIATITKEWKQEVAEIINGASNPRPTESGSVGSIRSVLDLGFLSFTFIMIGWLEDRSRVGGSCHLLVDCSVNICPCPVYCLCFRWNALSQAQQTNWCEREKERKKEKIEKHACIGSRHPSEYGTYKSLSERWFWVDGRMVVPLDDDPTNGDWE